MQPRIDSLKRMPAFEVWVVLAGVGLAAGLVALLAAPSFIQQPVLVVLVGIVTATPIVYRGLSGRWDPFEPIVIFCAGGFVLFFLRPVWMWMHDSWILGPYDARDGFSGAVAIGLVGFAALAATYFLDIGERIAAKVPPVRDDWDPGRVVFACLGIMVIATLLFAMFIGTSGGFSAVKNYFSGRDATLVQNLVGTATGPRRSAYLYLAPYMSLPVTLMLLEVWRRQRRPIYAALGGCVFALVLAMTIPRGDRTYLLALLLPLIALWYLRRERRPRALSIVAAILATMVVANALLQFRNKESRDAPLSSKVARSASHPLDAVNEFMLGPDVSMFSILAPAYQAMPKHLEFTPGGTLAATLVQPVPGSFWRGKPKDPEVKIYATLFPVNAAATQAGFASSTLGSFYADSGFVGVVIYCALLGIILRVMFEWWRMNKRNASVTIVYAATLPLLIILLRANPPAALGLWTILVAPILIAFWYGARRPVRARTSAPRAARGTDQQGIA
jgi:hypothetical protein